MSAFDYLILLLILAAALLALFRLKKGKPFGCSGCCQNCRKSYSFDFPSKKEL